MNFVRRLDKFFHESDLKGTFPYVDKYVIVVLYIRINVNCRRLHTKN